MILAIVWLPFVLLSASGAFALLVMGAPVPSQLWSVPPERLPRLFLLCGALGPLLFVLFLVKHLADSLDRAFVRAVTGPPPPPPSPLSPPSWTAAKTAPPLSEALYVFAGAIPEERRHEAVPAVHACMELMTEEEKDAFFSMCSDRGLP